MVTRTTMRRRMKMITTMMKRMKKMRTTLMRVKRMMKRGCSRKIWAMMRLSCTAKMEIMIYSRKKKTSIVLRKKSFMKKTESMVMKEEPQDRWT